MVMTLYKGPAFQIIKGGGAISSHQGAADTETSDQNWVMGPLMLIASCCSWAGFFILQVSIYSQQLVILHINQHICIFFNLWK